MFTQELIKGVRELKSAMLMMIVAGVLMLIGATGLIIASLMFLTTGLTVTHSPTVSSVSSYPMYVPTSSTVSVAVLMALVIAGGILNILAILKLRVGFASLRLVDFRYGIGYTGAILSLVGIVIVLVSAFLEMGGLIWVLTAPPTVNTAPTISGVTTAYTALLVIGLLVAFISYILLAIAFFRLGSDHKMTIIEVGAVFFILINFIGAILLFIGLTKLLNKLSQST